LIAREVEEQLYPLRDVWSFRKYPDPTRKKEGKFLKGCTPKTARRYATRGWIQEGQKAKFQHRIHD
jgi:hypothetical protein